MKIFVSYSRRDAGDFADQIQRHLTGFKHDVFTDVNNISAGDIWSSTIENNISACDIFVAIVTYGALQSPHVENEVLQAQREKKKIIPCFHRNVRQDDIKWELNKIQGVEFTDKYELARDLYSKIERRGPIAAVQGSKLKIVILSIVAIAILGSIAGFIVLGGGAAFINNNGPSPPTPDINNSAPVAHNIPSVSTSMDQPVNIQLLASDKDNDDLTGEITSEPLHGQLSDINQATGILAYTPNSGFTGTDEFTFRVNDGKIDSKNMGRVFVTINTPIAADEPMPNNTSTLAANGTQKGPLEELGENLTGSFG